MAPQYFYVLALAFLGGVAIQSLATNWLGGLAWLFIILGVLIGVAYCVPVRPGRVLGVVVLGLLGIALGIFRVGLDRVHDETTRFAALPSDAVLIEGVVVAAPDERERTLKLTVLADTITTANGTHEIATKVLITTERYPRYRYGDRIQITGKVTEPGSFITDTGREFDYGTYLWKDDIHYEMRFPEEVVLLAQDQGNWLVGTMIHIKESLVGVMNQIMHRPESALLAGELFGEKAALGGSLQDDFRRTGLIHVVVLSGYNVTLVAKFLLTIFSFVSVRIGGILALVGVVLFAILTGGGATVVRASIMAVLVIVANMTGREYLIARGLTVAAVVMVIINPRVLLFDIGFQLSFLATVGLVYLSPRIEPYLQWVPERFGIRENLIATTATQLFVLPLLVWYMGEVSIIALVTNVLVLGMVPVSMLLGFAAVVAAVLVMPIGMLIAIPAYLSLKYQVVLVEWFADLPGASVVLPAISSPWWILALYLPMMVLLVVAGSAGSTKKYESSWELSQRDVTRRSAG